MSAARGLVEQCGDLNGFCAVFEKMRNDFRDGEAGIGDVFNQDHVLADDGEIELVSDGELAGAFGGRAIAGGAQETDAHGDRDRPGEVRHEHEGAFEDADQANGPGGVIDGDCAPMASMRERI